MNILILMKEIVMFINNLFLTIICCKFSVRNNLYNMRNFHAPENAKKNSVNLGLDTISYHTAQFMEFAPN